MAVPSRKSKKYFLQHHNIALLFLLSPFNTAPPTMATTCYNTYKMVHFLQNGMVAKMDKSLPGGLPFGKIPLNDVSRLATPLLRFRGFSGFDFCRDNQDGKQHRVPP